MVKRITVQNFGKITLLNKNEKSTVKFPIDPIYRMKSLSLHDRFFLCYDRYNGLGMVRNAQLITTNNERLRFVRSRYLKIFKVISNEVK
jgi:hypothetical protein